MRYQKKQIRKTKTKKVPPVTWTDLLHHTQDTAGYAHCTQNANWFIHFPLPLQNTYNLCWVFFCSFILYLDFSFLFFFIAQRVCNVYSTTWAPIKITNVKAELKINLRLFCCSCCYSPHRRRVRIMWFRTLMLFNGKIIAIYYNHKTCFHMLHTQPITHMCVCLCGDNVPKWFDFCRFSRSTEDEKIYCMIE